MVGAEDRPPTPSGRRTIAKYLTTPAPPPVHRDRSSKLDSFKPAIAELLERDSTISAVLIEQRLRGQGFDGGMTIVKDYVRTLRKSTADSSNNTRGLPG